ncbi:MAG: hypothetical protein IKH90_10095 [Ruminococcus sp.]|nr:hypothetical protein [Ruminococcus sp.]
MKNILKRILTVSIILLASISLLTGCKHYCSYGGCMKEVENDGDRCAEHRGLSNDPNYGLPEKYKATGDWVNK